MGFEIDLTLASDNKGNLGPLDISSASCRRTASASRSTPAASRAAASCCSTPTRASTPAASSSTSRASSPSRPSGSSTRSCPTASRGFSLAHPHHGRVPADPARLRLHADRRRRPARPQPHGRRPTRCARAMHQGALDSVLFPRDIVANAPRIINDLRRLFPPRRGALPGRPDGEARLGHADASSASSSA